VAAGPATPARPATAAPAPANTGTNWPTMVPSIIRYGQWLLANPDPALAATITVPGCGAGHDLTAELQSLVMRGAAVRTTAPVITRTAGLTTTGTTTAAVDIQVSRPAEPVVDRATTRTRVIATLPELPSTLIRMTLLRGADNRWRLCDVTADGGGGLTALL
jgi:hypothetical protein